VAPISPSRGCFAWHAPVVRCWVTAISIVGLVVSPVGCGDDVEGGAGGAGGAAGTGGAGLGGHCASEVATVDCASDCAFDATAIDCATACTNLAAVCSDAACSVECDPQPADTAVCMMSCEGTKAQHCSNLAWGCYAQSDGCESAGVCFFDNKEAGL